MGSCHHTKFPAEGILGLFMDMDAFRYCGSGLGGYMLPVLGSIGKHLSSGLTPHCNDIDRATGKGHHLSRFVESHYWGNGAWSGRFCVRLWSVGGEALYKFGHSLEGRVNLTVISHYFRNDLWLYLQLVWNLVG